MNYIKKIFNTLFSDVHTRIDDLESTIKTLEAKFENLATSIPNKVEKEVASVDDRIKEAASEPLSNARLV